MCAVEGRADIKSLEMPKIAPHPPLFSSLLSFHLPSSSRPISFFFPNFFFLPFCFPPPSTPFIYPHSLPKSFTNSLADLLSSFTPSIIPSLLTSFHPNFFSHFTLHFLIPSPFSSPLILPGERSPSLLLYFFPLTPSSSPHHYLCLFVPKHRRSVHL